MNTTYVITGGAGLIGSHLAERLPGDAGEAVVRVLDGSATASPANATEAA